MNGIDLEALERWADVRETSVAIASAIFDLAEDDDEAQRIWESPTANEMAYVRANAWTFRSADGCDTLHWGNETIDKPT